MHYRDLSPREQQTAAAETAMLRSHYQSMYPFPWKPDIYAMVSVSAEELADEYGEPEEMLRAAVTKSQSGEVLLTLRSCLEDHLPVVGNIPLQTVLVRRDQELLAESSFVRNDPEMIQPTLGVISTGYETDLRRLLFTARELGIRKVFPARQSCGSEYVIAESLAGSWYGRLGIGLSSIGFRVPESGHDVIEVLYAGYGSTDQYWVNQVIYRMLANEELEDMEYMTGRSLDDYYD
ncbi:MAG: hypothetical protein TR69_WS6001000707 [candidate division WS6 bacterium OLB20]|uniref:Uncharacterized protein n=1 Tax=candidate division WS6 bacterium OLB20 TaxID=1617426 RepID=A0A136LYH5_9BACT|nr:MAG: hypothetical protein TR69_WS6001000707 [candidate division WS6 bacterium OLB20]